MAEAKAKRQTDPGMSASKEDQKALYYHLIRARRFDERCRRLFKQGRFPGTYFSAVGQEAAAVGAAFGLGPDDVIAPSHRELGAYITKGMPLAALMRQLFARADSPDKGKSHPCHFGYPEINLLTPASTMTAQVVVGTGMALALRMQKKPNVVLAFIGEGGTSRGAFHEALNFAGIHDLPIIYVCLNNLWAESVPAYRQSRITKFSDRAKAYGFAGFTIDGNDLLTVYQTVREAIERARAGSGPTLIECLTYRWYGHSEIDPANYRSADELESWKKRDPVALYERHLDETGIMSQAEREKIITQVDAEIEEAITLAEASPHPEAKEALDDVYSFSPAANFPARAQPTPPGGLT
ncbi:MAG TPA: thiamine pyrophosphate-dependent dehydrogenase E1 component subunit alpha [Acidobacteriota bacterium]|nr:thiamine pyrophosphate-dependent dehydrogenase E1 component subunit alpha [Acidobacteriota bacterium]